MLPEMEGGIILRFQDTPPTNKVLTPKLKGPASSLSNRQQQKQGDDLQQALDSAFGTSMPRACIISGGFAHLKELPGTNQLVGDSSVQKLFLDFPAPLWGSILNAPCPSQLGKWSFVPGDF